jgi:hypothetical protein
MDTTRHRPILFAFATALLVAACGGGGSATNGPGGPAGTPAGNATQPPVGVASQPPGGGETIDACALLTEAEIEDVTSFRTDSSLAGPQGGVFATGCEWILISDGIVPPAISLGIMPTGGQQKYQQFLTALDRDLEPIENLGDEAVDAEFGAVMVRSGDAMFQVQYIGDASGADDTELAAELARMVVANLGR